MKEIYSIVDIIFKAVHIGDVFEVLIFVFWRCLCLIMPRTFINHLLFTVFEV